MVFFLIASSRLSSILFCGQGDLNQRNFALLAFVIALVKMSDHHGLFISLTRFDLLENLKKAWLAFKMQSYQILLASSGLEVSAKFSLTRFSSMASFQSDHLLLSNFQVEGQVEVNSCCKLIDWNMVNVPGRWTKRNKG